MHSLMIEFKIPCFDSFIEFGQKNIETMPFNEENLAHYTTVQIFWVEKFTFFNEKRAKFTSFLNLLLFFCTI